MKKIITRDEAKVKGLKQYFTGEPCKNGHTEKRATLNGNCIRCELDRRVKRNQTRGYKRPFGVSKHPMYATFNAVRKRARDNGLDFDLDFYEITNNIPTTCPILGIPLFWKEKKQSDNSPSFDRINPNKGYTKDNVQIISWKANRIKNNGTILEHLLIAKSLSTDAKLTKHINFIITETSKDVC